jgi:glutathione reductase (NADPH)
MKHLGVNVLTESPHKKVTKNDDGTLTIHLDVKEGMVDKVTADRVLIALGRPPNVEPMLIKQNTSIALENGCIVVDHLQNTTVEGVYSVGDVTTVGNKWSLTPVAIRAGRMLSERLFNGKTGLHMKYENIATIIFSHPPIGTVGDNFAEACKKYGEDKVIVYKSDFINMFYSPAKNQDDKLHSYFKIICLKNGEGPENHKVIGVACIGKAVDEMM